MDGVFVVNKADGWTSHDVVGKMRRVTGIKRIGHLGTLDPLATGVLPLVIGRATRLAQFHVRADKVYRAQVRFGFSTSSYDRQGDPTSEPVAISLTPDQIEPLLATVDSANIQLVNEKRSHALERVDERIATVTADLDDQTRDKLFAANAERIYRLTAD
mgnify:CR=1 FL=1